MDRGAQKGNQNALKGRRLSSVLKQRLIERAQEDELMNVLLDKALEGDLQSIKEVFDRVDGKANQSIDIQADIVAVEKKLTKREIEAIAKGLEKGC